MPGQTEVTEVLTRVPSQGAPPASLSMGARLLSTHRVRGEKLRDPTGRLGEGAVERCPLDEMVERVMAGEITDAKTQIAILKTKRLLDSRKG